MIPGSHVLNESVMDGIVMLQPWTPYLGFRKPADPSTTGTPGWFKTPAHASLATTEVVYYLADPEFVNISDGSETVAFDIDGSSDRVLSMQSPGEPVLV